jgi:hypothetical protein
MPDDKWELSKRIAKAYRASGIAAKAYCGKLFIEREEGWEGPLDPTSIQATYADDIRTIEDHARAAATLVIHHLNDAEREFMPGPSSYTGYVHQFLSDPEKFKALGYDDRKTRLYITIIRSRSFWNDFG